VPHRIRIVVVGVRKLGAAILTEAIAGEPDLELVEVLADPVELAPLIRRGDIDVVIAEVDETERTDVFSALLYECPRLRVLVLSLRGADTALYELRPYRISLGNVSIAELLDAVRQTTAAATTLRNHTWANDL
jgi:DNA-binding NarL/FixJ family response regulator